MQSENIKKAQPELERLEKKYTNKTDIESQNQICILMIVKTLIFISFSGIHHDSFFNHSSHNKYVNYFLS